MRLIKILEKVAEWFKAADCKSVRLSYRRFESCSSQTLLLSRPSSSWFRMLLFHSKNKGSNPLGRKFFLRSLGGMVDAVDSKSISF